MSNNTKTKNSTFPFTYNGWDEACGEYGDIQFHGVKFCDVEFTDDFGSIRKGDKFDCVVIYHSGGQLVACINGEYDKQKGFAPQIGEVVVKFKVIPV